MPALSTPGIGSGLDIRGIVDKLMAVERQPLVRLGTRQIELKAQLSAFGKLKSVVGDFRAAMQELSSLDRFRVFTAESSDEAVLTASATSAAARGSYQFNVSRLAEAHQMAASTVLADSDTTLVGTAGEQMTITVGNQSFTVAHGGKTLAGVRDAINEASDNTGVTASILKDDAGFRLMLSANETGSSHAITLSYSGADPFALQTLNQDRDASGAFTAADLDAVVTVGGQFTITSTDNSLDGAIGGVTVNLTGTGSATLTVDRDKAAVKGRVEGLITAYNAVIKVLDDTGGDVLRGERAALTGLEAQLRSVLGQPVNVAGAFTLATEIGVTTKRDGTLELNDQLIDNALANGFDDVAALFADPVQGLAVRLEAAASAMLDTDGVLDARSAGLERQISDAEDRKAQLEQRLGRVEQRLLDQFNALDGLIARMQTTSSFLTSQLASISNIGRTNS